MGTSTSRSRRGSRRRWPSGCRSSRARGAWTRPSIRSLTGIAISDLRITTRFDPGYLGTALWAVIHEAGHALYNNGIAPELERTPLCRSVSLGFDESQSRLWENWVGRGRPFLELPPARCSREYFPTAFAGDRR